MVTEGNLAGHIRGLSTPALVGLLEGASVRAILDHLRTDQTTVGYEVNIRHLAPTPIGKKVRATSELLEVRGNKLLFRVEAYDEEKKVGEGTHRRAIVGTSFSAR